MAIRPVDSKLVLPSRKSLEIIINIKIKNKNNFFFFFFFTQNGGCPLIRACSLIRSNTVNQFRVFMLSAQIPEFGATRELTIVKTEKKAFGLNQKSYPQSVWQLVCEMQSHYGSKVITFRSILQVRGQAARIRFLRDTP